MFNTRISFTHRRRYIILSTYSVIQSGLTSLRREERKKHEMSAYGTTLRLAATQTSLKADSHTACRAHAVPLPCRATKGLECVFPI